MSGKQALSLPYLMQFPRIIRIPVRFQGRHYFALFAYRHAKAIEQVQRLQLTVGHSYRYAKLLHSRIRFARILNDRLSARAPQTHTRTILTDAQTRMSYGRLSVRFVEDLIVKFTDQVRRIGVIVERNADGAMTTVDMNRQTGDVDRVNVPARHVPVVMGNHSAGGAYPYDSAKENEKLRLMANRNRRMATAEMAMCFLRRRHNCAATIWCTRSGYAEKMFYSDKDDIFKREMLYTKNIESSNRDDRCPLPTLR